MAHHQDRINYSGDLKQLFEKICLAYNIGNLISFEIIKTGYEDFNIKIKSDSGCYLAKIFSKYRTKSEIDRLVSIFIKVIDNNISVPKLQKTQDGYVFKIDGLCLVVFEFIDGGTFYETQTTPTNDDLDKIIKQAAQINKIAFDDLSYLPDSWGVQNIHNTYEQVKNFITDKTAYNFINNAIKKWNEIPINKLPVAFVHGDIITTNVIKSKNDEIFIIDFSVANLYPRIQELAVIVSNLLAGNGKTLKQNATDVMNLYEKYIKLQDIEKKFLESFVWAETAMIYMGAIRERFIHNDNSAETDYWINLCYQDMLLV